MVLEQHYFLLRNVNDMKHSCLHTVWPIISLQNLKHDVNYHLSISTLFPCTDCVVKTLTLSCHSRPSPQCSILKEDFTVGVYKKNKFHVTYIFICCIKFIIAVRFLTVFNACLKPVLHGTWYLFNNK
jgi:hypothetical protein